MTITNGLYPAFLQLRERKVVVVGGGNVAERKVRAVVSAGARVHVASPELTPALQAWAGSGTIGWMVGRFEAPWLDGAWLVIAATDDRQVNAQVSREAEKRGIWINVVDDPELSAFQVPAVVDRAPITVAISSGGHAPVLARRLRERFETLVGHGIGQLAALLAERRAAIQASYSDLAQRRRFYDWTLDGPVLALIERGDMHAATEMLDEALERPMDWPRQLLTLLQAPDADPGLLTLKGLRSLHQADAIVFDPNCHEEAIVAMSRRDAERLPVNIRDWLEGAEAMKEIRRLLQIHGRVVALVPQSDHEAVLQASARLQALLEADGIPVQRL